MKSNNVLFFVAIGLILFSLLISGLVLFDQGKIFNKEKVTGGATQGQVNLCIDVGPPPVLDSIGNLNATQRVLFNYTLNATSSVGQPIYYYDNATFFDVNKTTGLINFTPTASDVGSHSVRFWATHDVCDDSYDEEIITFTVIANATEDDSPPPGGQEGGGGSGAGPSQIKIKEVVWDRVEQGKEYIIEVYDKEIGVEIIRFLLLRIKEDVSISIIRLNSNPTDIPLENVYKMFLIESENVLDNEIKYVKIKISVSKKWLRDYYENTVILWKYNHILKEWIPLKTEKIDEGIYYSYFEAETEGFSYFAIIAEPKTEKDKQKPSIKPFARECDKICEFRDILECPLDCWQFLLIGLAVLVLIVGIIISLIARSPSFGEEKELMKEISHYLSMARKRKKRNKKSAKEILKKAKKKYNQLSFENRKKYKDRIHKLDKDL